MRWAFTLPIFSNLESSDCVTFPFSFTNFSKTVTILEDAKTSESGQIITSNTEEVQTITMSVNRYGYSPNSFVLKKGVKVRWVINVNELRGCNREIIVRDYGLDIKLQEGENIVEFTPTKEGIVRWRYWMGMISGMFVVVNDTSDKAAVDKALASAPKVGGCGCGRSKSEGSCGGR